VTPREQAREKEMAYCPEDGVEMTPRCLHFFACYDCPVCGLHWYYDGRGGYFVVDRDACPAHLRCDQCWLEALARLGMDGGVRD
jgi:hypothetical protein